ncbi:PP2C family protein-serine/threonine phosphatase [Streptomyces roseus]|uniref:PP2C family protein-serine/threonine phosphatase n=1 Tax=Streptomyces roseus TaxID=66430 RepID=UPI0036865C96
MANTVTPAHWRLAPVMSVAPALAAATCALGGTALAGVLALVLVNVSARAQHTWGDLQFQVTLLALVAVSLASLLTCHARLRQQRELVRVRLVAETAQRVLLPPLPEELGPLRLSSLYAAAQQDARIGGDVYECLDTVHGMRLLIGDVRGKGLSSVEASAALLSSFREAAHTEASVTGLVSRLEASIHRYAHSGERPYAECFATALIIEIMPTGVGHIVHCGHPAPLIVRCGQVSALEPTGVGLPLGLADLSAGDARTPDVIELAPGDRLLLCTDGVTECRDRRGRFYPLLDRLPRWSAQPMDAMLGALHTDLLRHCNGVLQDDVAILVVEYTDASRPPVTVYGRADRNGGPELPTRRA